MQLSCVQIFTGSGPWRRAQLQGAECGGVPQRGESQLGMLAGSLGQVPAFSIPISPNAKHGIGDHLERPSNGSDCCWGVKAAWGSKGRWGWRQWEGRAAHPLALPCPQTGTELSARTRPPFALRSALLTLSRSPASLDQEEQKPQIVAGGNVV